jgi:hypothetical protein
LLSEEKKNTKNEELISKLYKSLENFLNYAFYLDPSAEDFLFLNMPFLDYEKYDVSIPPIIGLMSKLIRANYW